MPSIRETRGAPSPVSTRGFRKELHGVRGLAIIMIVIFHVVGNGRVSGGIDVFLAITGFLAVPSLLRRCEAGRGGWFLDLGKRFSDLFRRLCLPLIPVLIAVGIAGVAILPTASQGQMFREIVASALFYENWELVNSQLTYDAAGPSTSPLQHIWSTSIQGQFHLVMTFVVMLVAFIALKIGAKRAKALTAVLFLLTFFSFWWAVADTTHSQDSAYFSTFSRAWQLTGPAILGLWVSKIRLPATARASLSWLGIGMLITCPFLFDGARQFPGPEALWPVIGVCLILASGHSGLAWGGDRLLATRFFQRFGDISYSLYLWHWPILIFALTLTERSRPTPLIVAYVLALSILMGYIGKTFFEDGLARWKALKPSWVALPLAAALGTSAFVAGPSLVSWSDDRARQELIDYRLNGNDPNHPGAVAIIENLHDFHGDPIPSRGNARGDIPWHYLAHQDMKCVQRFSSTSLLECEDGTPQGDRPLVVVTGGSHAGQWSGVIEALAEEYDWKVVVFEKSGCLLSTEPNGIEGGAPITADCHVWNQKAMEEIIDRDADLVVTLGTSRRIGTVEGASEGMIDAFKSLNDAGIPVFAFRENPTLEKDMGKCWEDSTGAARCTEDRSHFYDPIIDRKGLDVDPAMTHLFDTSRYLCDGDECSTVIGNVLVFRDLDHITNTYAITLQTYIEDDLRSFVPQLFNAS